MIEKFNKNTKVEQLTNMFLSRGEEKGLTVKDPFHITNCPFLSSNFPSFPAYGIFRLQPIWYAQACSSSEGQATFQ